MEIKDHLLKGANVSFKKTPNTSGEFKAGDLDTIILHYTAGPTKNAINTLTNPRVKASAHLVISRDGSVTQLAPFNLITWHAGQSQYEGRIGFNNYSIGIEIENDGILQKSGNIYRAWYGATHPEEEVIEATHRNSTSKNFWHTYTQEQIETVEEVCRLLVETYEMKFILGHDEIAPKRKQDPGPAFPIDRIRNGLLHADRNANDAEESLKIMTVDAGKLNIRALPSTTAEQVAKSLQKGQKVKVLEEKNGWIKVRVSVEGWVFGQYLK